MTLAEFCSHGSEERRNRILFEYHAFSIITVLSLSAVFLGSQKLKRIYQPLYYIINAILLLQLFVDVLYFRHHPYSEESPGNCAEILFGRVVVLLTMFGELHQLYFVAHALGLQSFHFKLSTLVDITLEQGLRIAITLAAISIFCSLFLRRLFMVCHDFWALFIIAMQLYIIKVARSKDHVKQSGVDGGALVDAHNDAVSIFQTITWLQLMPLIVALADRLLELENIFLYPSLDGVMLILEFLSTYLFFIKILVLQEKASSVQLDVYFV